MRSPQVNDFKLTLTGFARLLTLGVIRAAQRNIHQCKMESIKPCIAARRSTEHAFDDQNGGDGGSE